MEQWSNEAVEQWSKGQGITRRIALLYCSLVQLFFRESNV